MNELQNWLTRTSSKRTPEKVRQLSINDLLAPDPDFVPAKNRLVVEQLEIAGLLSFGETVTFELGRLNILVGPNGSGKSNLIDCIRVLRQSPFDVQDAFVDSGFEEWIYKGASFGTAFLRLTCTLPGTTSRIQHTLRLSEASRSRARVEELVCTVDSEGSPEIQHFVSSKGGSSALLRRNGRRRRLAEDQHNPFQSVLSEIRDADQYPEITGLASLYSSIRIYSEWGFGRSSNLREATPANRSSTTLSENMSDLALVLNGLENSVAHESIRELLSELKETYRDYITRILFGRVGLELLESPFERTVPAKRLSDGTLRFLALAAVLTPQNLPPLICIEEPELGMHPDMIRMVAGMLIEASSRTQLIISTHSEHLLSALQDDFDFVFSFNASSEGSMVRSFDRTSYREWSEGHNLGELWTAGEIGGNRY